MPAAMPPGTKREPQYSLLTGSFVLLLGLGALTIIPHSESGPNMLGYHTLCSFAPVSTIVLLALAGFARVMRDVVYKTRPRV
jgi:hypothetical protein